MKLFGIPIKFHWSALFLLLIMMPNFSLVGLLFGAGIFALVMVFLIGHEIAHAIAAEKFGYRTKDITIMALGGIARVINSGSWTPKEEALISIAGPAFNIICAIILASFLFITSPLLSGATITILSYALAINIILGVFNLIPAYPMDGGRILKSFCYHFWPGEKGRQIAIGISTLFGLGIIISGLFMSSFLMMIVGVLAIFFTQSMGKV